MPLNRDRHDPGALDDLKHLGQRRPLAAARKIDSDDRHRAIACRAERHANRSSWIPGSLRAPTAGTADQVEDHHRLGRADMLEIPLHGRYNDRP